MSKFWKHFLSNGRNGNSRGYLGMSGRNVPVRCPLAQRFKVVQARGVEVSAVRPGSPAEQAGVLEGDVLVKVAEEPITSVATLHQLLTHLPVDVPLSLVLLRGRRFLERFVLLCDFPDPAWKG